MKEAMRLMAVATLIVTAAVGTAVLAKGDDNKAPAEVTVHFAMPQPQPPQAGTPGTPDNSSTHFLTPDDATVRKGGTVIFVVNGGGHGLAIHPVSKNTTREDIAEDLCQGGTNEADRRQKRRLQRHDHYAERGRERRADHRHRDRQSELLDHGRQG